MSFTPLVRFTLHEGYVYDEGKMKYKRKRLMEVHNERSDETKAL